VTFLIFQDTVATFYSYDNQNCYLLVSNFLVIPCPENYSNQFFTLPQEAGCDVLWWDCLFVCLFVCSYNWKTERLNVAKFLCMLSMSVPWLARSFSDNVAICYVHPVLWMTSYFHIMTLYGALCTCFPKCLGHFDIWMLGPTQCIVMIITDNACYIVFILCCW